MVITIISIYTISYVANFEVFDNDCEEFAMYYSTLGSTPRRRHPARRARSRLAVVPGRLAVSNRSLRAFQTRPRYSKSKGWGPTVCPHLCGASADRQPARLRRRTCEL